MEEARLLRNTSSTSPASSHHRPVCSSTDQPGWETGIPLLSFHCPCPRISQASSAPAKPLRGNCSRGAATGGPACRGHPQNPAPWSFASVTASSTQGAIRSLRVCVRFVGLRTLLIYFNPLKPSKPWIPAQTRQQGEDS